MKPGNLSKIGYENGILIFVFITIGILSVLFMMKIKLKSYEGAMCGGGWGQYPEFCKPGYLCDYSSSLLFDEPGRCIKLTVGKTYPVHYRNQLYFEDEDLWITTNKVEDECGRLNQKLHTEGCINAGRITWDVTVKKSNKTEVIIVDSLRGGKVSKSALGYNFIFDKIDRPNLILTVLH